MPNKLDINKKHLTFALPLELLAKVDHEANRRGMTRTDFVRLVLESELDNVELTAEELQWIVDMKRANAERRSK